MVAEEADQTDGKHSGHKEQEHNVKPSNAPIQFPAPKQQEVAQGGDSHVDAIQQGVAEEQHEELVIAKVYAVVYLYKSGNCFQYNYRKTQS